MCARNVEICQNEGNDESCGHALLERNVFPGADAVKEKDSLWTGCGSGQKYINIWRYELNILCGVLHITKSFELYMKC